MLPGQQVGATVVANNQYFRNMFQLTVTIIHELAHCMWTYSNALQGLYAGDTRSEHTFDGTPMDAMPNINIITNQALAELASVPKGEAGLLLEYYLFGGTMSWHMPPSVPPGGVSFPIFYP